MTRENVLRILSEACQHNALVDVNIIYHRDEETDETLAYFTRVRAVALQWSGRFYWFAHQFPKSEETYRRRIEDIRAVYMVNDQQPQRRVPSA